jgi:hypothetical protein
VETTVVSRQGKEGAIALCTKGDFVGEASLTPLPLYLERVAVYLNLGIPSKCDS